MNKSAPNLLDALDLPALEANTLLYLTRHGPAHTTTVAQALGIVPADAEGALAVLAKAGRVRLFGDGRARIVLGWSRRRTLPTELWQALVPSDRQYSAQEIATLRTAIPMLQFARAKLGEFSDHGPAHALRVKSFASQLGYTLGLSTTEQHLLRAGALFHDVGNVVDRHHHHTISEETVHRLTASGDLPFSAEEATIVGLLCRWHRTHEADFRPDQVDTLRDERVRTGLLASILRVADAMDIDHRRSDYAEPFARVLRFFFSDQLPYWTSLEEIGGVRIRCLPADNGERHIRLHVFVKHQTDDNMQIEMLRKDLLSTPFDWAVQVIVADDPPNEGKQLLSSQPVLVAFPFEPHSLIMAALSRKHLRACGYEVELLSYPDTADGSVWLWSEALADINPTDCAELVVIGDRPHARTTPDVYRVLEQWQAAAIPVHLLNRHEANWQRLLRATELGASATLGGDWAYFWGDATKADMYWGFIAALTTRDPTQSTVGITDEEQRVMQGFLRVAYDAAAQGGVHSDWAAIAETLMERIAADDRAWFAAQAHAFSEYARNVTPTGTQGRVLVFEQIHGVSPQTAYWALEAAIERHGRSPVRGIHFNVPYALASWRFGDTVELLAINHWREEDAIPVRLLYPTDLGPTPEGHESAVLVRLPASCAATVMNTLVAACNNL
jgi:hypothetical protein